MKIQLNKQTLGCSFLAMLASATAFSQEMPVKPNILVIMTDQQSAESLSYNLGNKYLKTPNMDALAKHGVTFANAYCANPLCIPSRSSIFTGRYPHEMGIQANENKKNDPAQFPTLGTIFKNAGYETGYFGKWHLPYNQDQPDAHGFDVMANNKGNGVDKLLPAPAIKFLETKRDHPFLLVVSFVNPHNICEWARGQKLPDGEIGDPPSADQCPPLRANHLPSKNETDIMQTMRTSYQLAKTFPVSGFDDTKWRQYIWAYYRLIEKVDNEIGKVLNALRESGLDKNTMVVFMADHGDCQGAHLWNQKTVFYEEASKVPFIISNPAIKPRKSDYLVQTGIDVIPTLCGLAGIPAPERARGMNLKPLITNESAPDDRKFVVVSDNMVQGEAVNGEKPEPEGRMLRNNRFKYWIYNAGKQRETLYDLKNDPGEMVNLASDPKFRADLENCRTELAGWAQKYQDPFLKYLVKE